MMKMPRERIREMMEMMGMILKKSVRLSANVWEINVTTRRKGKEIIIMEGGETVPSWDTISTVMIGRGATLIRKGDSVDSTQRL